MASHRAAHCPSVGIILPPTPTCVLMASSTSTASTFRFARKAHRSVFLDDHLARRRTT
jgi:hypothetical protein